MHLLLKFNDVPYIFIDNKLMSELWGFGFVRVNKIDGVDNVGAYVTAYLTDLVVEDDFEGKTDTKIIEGESKKVVKGGRLYLYPTGMRYYRRSRGIKEPVRRRMPYSSLKKDTKLGHLVSRREFDIKNNDFENKIIFEEYNSIR